MPIRLLVVDDEVDFIESIVMRIKLHGIDAHGVTGGARALEYLEENPDQVNVVMLDIKMPGMDGLETLKQIKERHPSLACIVVTGYGSQEFSELGRDLGAFDYLVKPIPLETILERIEDAYRSSGAGTPD